MKEIQLRIEVQTLKLFKLNYRQVFKKHFDWRSRFYFEMFVGSYRYVSPVFQLHQTNDDDVLVFHPKVVLTATHYQGKYVDLWLKESGSNQVIVGLSSQTRDTESCYPSISCKKVLQMPTTR